jgi:thiamine pyrophosphokinase
MSICYIVSAMPVDEKPPVTSDDMVIAADSGILHLKKWGIQPNLLIGDFDSLGFIPTDDSCLVYPKEKDDTDTLLAVRAGLERDFSTFVLLGCLGGRLDHTLANLQTLAFLLDHFAFGILVGEGTLVLALRHKKLHLSSEHKGVISLFSAGDSAILSIRGLKYSIEKRELTCRYPYGVSNEFIGQSAEIEVVSGDVYVLLEGTISDVPDILQGLVNL